VAVVVVLIIAMAVSVVDLRQNIRSLTIALAFKDLVVLKLLEVHPHLIPFAEILCQVLPELPCKVAMVLQT
jgi:hypothetical protein